MKVYHLFQFFNELDLLEIKLATLYDIVDYFVISESTHTFTGIEKPLYFQENKARYNNWSRKIISNTVRDTPDNYRDLINTRPKNELHNIAISHVISYGMSEEKDKVWLREQYEKEILIKGLLGHDDDDIVIVSDLDEIPDPLTLNNVVSYFKKNPLENRIFHLAQGMFYYYFNLQKRNEYWVGPIVLRAKTLLEKGFCSLRNTKNGEAVPDGGWHFTYTGGPYSVKKKIEAFSHQEYNTPMVVNNLSSSIERAVSTGRDLFYRPAEWVVRDINDGTFPQYIVDNREKFSDYIYKPQ